ncbi:diguanylate cyclase domain-containing protein [Lacibacterium aquatile]|uniref:diguanylate cyclase n=1 Tax=Lacibacterium aquatile TaxID=1168082 RepID=A0ABW5DQ39_9PROT
MAISFTTEPASRLQKRLIVGLSVILCGLAISAGFNAAMPLAPVPAFLPAYAMAVIITDLLTAYLMASQYRILRRPSLLVLASAYLYSGLIVIPQMLVFPGVFSPTGMLGAGAQSAVWLWVMWHGGFPILVSLYLLADGYERPVERPTASPGLIGLMVAVSVALVLAATLAATIGHDRLPQLIVTNSYLSLANSLWGQGVLVANAIAFIAVLGLTRCRTVGQLGLAFAILASLVDAALTLAGGARFSLGWYVARMCTILASGSVLAVFIYEMTSLYACCLTLNSALERMAFVDALTGIANRRQFDQRLEAEWNRAYRDGRPLALILLDIDHFKRFNDRYGHPAGDECLRRVAWAINSCTRRPGDLAARYGGEEFAVILPNSDLPGAMAIAEKISQAVRAMGLKHENGTSAGIVTVSAGVASLRPSGVGATIAGLKSMADAALYDAKEHGRDRVEASTANAA